MCYYGLFYEVHEKYKDEIKCEDFYEGFIADFYDVFTSNSMDDNFEIDIYIENWLKCKGSILELACGTGRITIELAKIGVNLLAVDNSNRMLCRLEEKIKSYNEEIRNRIGIYNKDIFKLDIEEEFNMAILPATTISLLAGNFHELVSVFNNIYKLLPSKGKFIFDYKLCIASKEKGEINKFSINIYGQATDVLMQEFNDFKKKVSTLNIYLEVKEENKTKRYLSYTNRKILDPNFIYNLIDKTKFHIIEEIDKPIGNNQFIRFVVLEK